MLISVLTDNAFAMWAKHAVVAPATVEAYESYAPLVSRLSSSKVRIVLPKSSEPGEWAKGYFLIVCTNRLSTEELNLRFALGQWKQDDKIRAFMTNANDALRAQFNQNKNRYYNFDSIVEIRPITADEYALPDESIEIVLDLDIAKKSYVVWDFIFIYGHGSAVMDGGLWLTYDIPAFIDDLEKTESASP